MDHEVQAGKNFAWGAFSQIITRIFGLVFFVFMSHILLEKGMGQYNFVASFVDFWFIFSDFGISSYMYREWSRGDLVMDQIKNDFNIIFTLKLLMSGIIFVPFFVINWFINQDIIWLLVLYFFFVVLSLFISQMETYLNSVNNFKFGAIRSLIEKIFIISIGGLLLFLFRNVESLFVAMIISQVLSLGYYLFGRFPFMPKFVIDWVYTKELIKKGLPFAFFAIFVSLYGRIDMVMLRYMQGFEAVGWYSAGYKAYEVANIFPGVLFLPAIFPVLSRIFNLEAREKYYVFLNRSIRILFATSLLFSIFFIFSAPYLIGIFFPDSFVASVLAMRIIVLVLVVSSLSTLFNYLMIIQNKEKTGLKIIIVSCFINVLLNIILIPRYSLYGAAWATVIAEVFNLFLLQFYTDWQKDKKMLSRMFFMVLLVVCSLSVIKYFGYTNNIYVGIVYVLAILVLFWSLKMIQKGDLNMFYLPIKNKLKVIFFNNTEI